MMTDWFPPETKPVHKGWYQTAYNTNVPAWFGWSHWNGKNWGTIYYEANKRKPYHDQTDLYWRGVTSTNVVPHDACAWLLHKDGTEEVFLPNMKDDDIVPFKVMCVAIVTSESPFAEKLRQQIYSYLQATNPK